MSLDREADFHLWYNGIRRQQMGEESARQIFFGGIGSLSAECAKLQLNVVLRTLGGHRYERKYEDLQGH